MTQTVGPHEVPELLDNVFGMERTLGKPDCWRPG